jgi:hypothetical protein
LAGSAVALPLPIFDCLLDSRGVAWANGDALPTRFGIWFWGNGIRPEEWEPRSTGSNWTPSTELAPLADLVPYLSVISGCEVKTDDHPHHSGMAGIFTGMIYQKLDDVRDTISSTFAGPSVDQLVADHWSGLTPFRSLEIGITRFHGTDEGSSFEHLSHNGPNNPNPCEYDPAALYRRLFGYESNAQLDLARSSVLDAVHEQTQTLNAKLGTADQIRLEQLQDSIRTLENRLASQLGACGVSTQEPTAISDIDGQEQIEEKNEIMGELTALALACDLSRVFSIQWSTAGSAVVVWQVGATDSLHQTCHDEASPQPTVHAATTFTMENLATFLGQLRNTPEGDGNLLDRCSILCTSELSDGYEHTNTEYPILIAGLGNGRLKGGVHYRSTNAANASKGVLTAVRGAGVDMASFGEDAGYADSTFGELES